MPTSALPPSSSGLSRRDDPSSAATPPRRPVRAAATTGLFLLALIAALHFGRDFFLPIAFAVTIALMLRPLVRLLRRCFIPEPLGAALVVVGLVGTLIVATMATYEPAMEWSRNAPQTLRKVQGKIREVQHRVEEFGRAAAEVEKLTNMDQERVPSVQVKEEAVQTTVARFTVDAVASTVIVLVLVFFLLATHARFLHKALELLVQPDQRDSKASIIRDTEQSVSRYLFTIALINVGLGVVVGAAMWAWGMPNPILWGAMATIANFVPYLGALTGVAITAAVAIVTFNDLRWAAVPLTYFLLTSFEGMLITPSILGRRFALDPVVVFVWLVFWGWLWGISGALLAMPMLVMLRMISEHSASLGAFGRLISSEGPLRGRRARAR